MLKTKNEKNHQKKPLRPNAPTKQKETVDSAAKQEGSKKPQRPGLPKTQKAPFEEINLNDSIENMTEDEEDNQPETRIVKKTKGRGCKSCCTIS